MRFAERARAALARPRLLVVAAVVLQWLTTLAIALRAADVSWGLREAVNVLLLGPLALVCAYRIAAAVGGVALGAWTLLVWVAAPWLAPLVTLDAYDATLRDDVLPLMVGLTPDLGYAEGVALLAATALLVRPSRVTLAGAAAIVAALGVVWLTRASPLPELSLDAFQAHMAGLREYFWSQRLLQWLPLAGAVGVARRSPALAIALSAWLAAYLLFRGAQPGVGFEDGELFRVLLPALPAYLVLTAALPLLVPTLAARLGPLARPAGI
jgi:hypothetical protein